MFGQVFMLVFFFFFFKAEFSDLQMQSPGCLNNEVNHKITRDITQAWNTASAAMRASNWEPSRAPPSPLTSIQSPSSLDSLFQCSFWKIWIKKKSVSNSLRYCLYFLIFWLFGHESCGILPSQPGIKSASPSLEGEVLITGPTRKSLHQFWLLNICKFWR